MRQEFLFSIFSLNASNKNASTLGFVSLFLVKVMKDNGVRLHATWEITWLQNLIKYGTGTFKADRKQTKMIIISVLY